MKYFDGCMIQNEEAYHSYCREGRVITLLPMSVQLKFINQWATEVKAEGKTICFSCTQAGLDSLGLAESGGNWTFMMGKHYQRTAVQEYRSGEYTAIATVTDFAPPPRID
jgi:hypothetical protein